MEKIVRYSAKKGLHSSRRMNYILILHLYGLFVVKLVGIEEKRRKLFLSSINKLNFCNYMSTYIRVCVITFYMKLDFRYNDMT